MAKKNRRKQRHPLLLFIGLFLVLSGVYFVSRTEPTFSSQPSQEKFSKNANQQLTAESLGTPLLLQTDERWAQRIYGTGENNDIANNGCALLSLSMVLSHWRETTVDPNEVFDWAQNTYFVADAGTAWSIFPDFAQHYQLNFHDLGNDFTQAEAYLQQNIPVIISITAGDFTDGGHILVLAGTNDDQSVRVLDPNDDSQKLHYQRNFKADEIKSQTIHYWTFTA